MGEEEEEGTGEEGIDMMREDTDMEDMDMVREQDIDMKMNIVAEIVAIADSYQKTFFNNNFTISQFFELFYIFFFFTYDH